MEFGEKVKRGLECCINGECNSKRKTCPYRKASDCASAALIDALSYIRELEARVAELERVKKELDAAVADINMCCPCEVCTRSCTYDKVNPYDECADFEWRGVQEDA